MWARAAWAAMLAVSVLMWIERTHAAAIDGVELLEWQKPQIQVPVAQVFPIYFEAKFGLMFGGAAEYIIVFDPSPDDPISSPIRVQFNHGDLANVGEIFGFGSNYPMPNECGIREGEIFWKASIEELERGVCPQINRWWPPFFRNDCVALFAEGGDCAYLCHALRFKGGRDSSLVAFAP